MSLLETQHIQGQKAVDRFGVCCCPTATMLNQIWRVRLIETLTPPRHTYTMAYCHFCGRLAGADR